MCIANKNKILVELSQQDIISCDNNNHKCQGDRIDNTCKFLEREGTVSLQCKPYESANGYVPNCRKTCKNLFVKYAKYRARPGSWKFLYTIDEIKTKIYKNGPISAGMAIFEDFSFYKGDI